MTRIAAKHWNRLFLFILGLLLVESTWSAPQVDVFAPQGEAKSVRQITVRFSEPIVAFGDPRVVDPFNVRCEGDPGRLKGQGRWADTKNWVYDYNADLPGGQRCTFTLKPDVKSVAGVPIEGDRVFTFNTGGPAALNTLPREDDEVDEDQTFLLALDTPIDTATLNQAWCEAASINERIPVKLLTDSEVREILSANRDAAYGFLSIYFKDRRGLLRSNFKVEDKRWRSLPLIGLRCGRRLPPGADMALVIGADVKSKTGVARTTPQRLAFTVRPAFTVQLSCERANKDAACLPVTPMRLQFNAPVPRDAAARIHLKSEQGVSYDPVIDPNVKTVDEIRFDGPFPEKTRFTIDLPRDFRDDAGREPTNKSSFPLATATDENPPLVKFPSRFGVLELNADPVLPVTVRNVEATLPGKKIEIFPQSANNGKPIPGRSLRVAIDEAGIIKRLLEFLDPDRDSRAQAALGHYPLEGELPSIGATENASSFELPRANGEKPLEVIGIPFNKPGFYIVELASPRLGRVVNDTEHPYYVATSVLITNLAVHLKQGRESSLAWVTTLDHGKPVPDATVTVRDCAGRLLFDGSTDSSGIALIGDKLPAIRAVPRCKNQQALFVFARLGNDLAFTRSDWNQGIQPWNFNLRTAAYISGPLTIHTVFDRTLFRAGETVSMKHIARVPTATGFNLPAARNLPNTIEVTHLGSGQKFKLDVKFDAQGVAESTWKIPPEAKLGTYRLMWPQPDTQSDAQFRVEAFRVPLMRATLAAPKEPLIRPTAAKLDAAVSYLSGGPASNQAVKIRYRVEPRSVSFPNYDDFSFGGKPVKVGIEKGMQSDDWTTLDADEETPSQQDTDTSSPATTRSLTLDQAGTATVNVDKLPVVDRPASLLVEMEYSDPNGELLTAATRVALHPSSIYVGLKPEGWAANKDGVRVQALVVDPTGKPLASRQVDVDVYERKTYSYRQRLLGGFYAYENSTETRRVGRGCTGTTDARGLLFCAVKPGTSGELILVAHAQDSAGREAYSTTSVWVRGDDEWWFEPANNDRIDLIPEKKRYEPGETAKFQVRMPFREATVLVTVEREGVLSQKVVTLSGKSPIIEVPIAGSYGPNVFVSALAVRGRVDPEVPGPYAWLKRAFYRVGYWLGLVDEIPEEHDTRPTALVDLTKPAYKLGIAEIKVGRRDYTLNVKLSSDRTVFRVRDTAHIGVTVTDSDGKPAKNGEIALAAVDEGLLELMDNTSWNILDAMLGERPEEVTTSTVQGQVIGKRHFGKKSAPPGGGGGRAGARELFDTLLLWKGRIALDDQGRANIDVPLNDALTGFRIVAIAQAGAALFGYGMTAVRSTQDLMLFSGLPPVVREQDDFSALFTLRNTTAQPLSTRFNWTLRDKPGDDKSGKVLASGDQTVALAANEAKLVAVPVKTPIGVEQLYWDITANADGGARDTLRTTQKVLEVHPVRVYQATLAQLNKPLQFPVELPTGAVPGRGGIRIEVSNSLAGELSAVREFFVHYPYTCLEQRASIAIGLGDDALWRNVTASVPNYLDRDGLARYFPVDLLNGSDVLTAYLIQIADDSGHPWPEDARNRMLAGLEGFVAGRVIRGSALPTADLTIRKLAAIEALSRHGRAQARMLDTIAIDPALWPSSALIDWIGILKRVPDIPQREARLKTALSLLRSRVNFQGTVMTFSTERNDALWWLMISGDVNANRALLAVLDQPDWRDDIGRMVRGSLSRQLRGRWSTTVANAWGTVAISHFAREFEKEPVTGNTVVDLAGKSIPLSSTASTRTSDFEWPSGKANLEVSHKGSGAPWAIVQSRAALPLTKALSSGYAITRTVTAIEQKDTASYSRGDVYRVSLDIDAQTDMTWVVVDDPIPSGAAILGSGLGRDAGSFTQGEKSAGYAWPAFVERTFTSYRAYYQFVPKGHFKLEYTVRVNNPGRFDLPATRVEAMYAPEMFGELPNNAIAVKQ